MVDGSMNEMKFTCEINLSADVTIFTADISPSRENARRVFMRFPKISDGIDARVRGFSTVSRHENHSRIIARSSSSICFFLRP